MSGEAFGGHKSSEATTATTAPTPLVDGSRTTARTEPRGGYRGRRSGGGPKTCFNCGESDHLARDCQSERTTTTTEEEHRTADRTQYRRCFNCGKMGHISADCTKPSGNKACYNCGQEGHILRDCPVPRDNE